ncbi:glycoside hydrolase family 5 protein [Labilibaculum euxinus]|uniref:glycoside hydrolase family 5 protein n=1 Tax=Labilibaculum euxinus TaxID=2686357 RepID=UPI000F6239FC|nr:cellulase family glycosylhydrolase [Labilibaculum euxinus]MDQ1770602.1 cellulase family glycosylhydrolase [Labilibaculum euxinus]
MKNMNIVHDAKSINMMSKIWIFFILVLLFTSCQKAEKKFVYVDGENIYSAKGDLLHLKGVNLGNWLLPEGYMFKLKDCNSPRQIDQSIRELIGDSAATAFWDSFLETYITEADIKWLSEAGVNIIRLPFDYRLLTHDDFLGRDMHGYKYLDKAISWCEKYNIYVLLDMHAAPGGQTGDNIDNSDGYPWLMVDEGMKQKVADIWQEIAKRYANNTAVIGYNLLNEPIPQYFDDDNLKPYLEPLYKKITKAIREVDSNHIVFLGGAVWETDFSVFSEPFDDQLAYTFHKYWMPPEQKEIQQYVDFRDKYKVPLLMGESGENEDAWVKDFRELLDKNDIHWTFWPYKKMDNTRGPMNFNEPIGYDNFITYAESDRSSFRNIRALRDSIGGIKREEIVAVLKQFVENSRFENCYPNEGYCKALGFFDKNISYK